MTEMNEILPADVRRSMKHAIEDVGLENMINEIGLDKVIDAVGLDKVIDAVGLENVIDVVGVGKLKEAIARRESEKKKTKKTGRST
jgi:hypothetical protein